MQGFKLFKNVSALALCLPLLTAAQPVWHCSRTETAGVAPTLLASNEASNQFSIASLGSSGNVIGVSVHDLMDVYSGVPVRIGGLPLSACYVASDDDKDNEALISLGLNERVIQSLSRKSAIVRSNLFAVNHDSQMLSCISKHFPAVGYLKQVHETEEVMPCY